MATSSARQARDATLGCHLMDARPLLRGLLCAAVAVWLLAVDRASIAQSQQQQRGEELIRNQEKIWGLSCKAVHPKAHSFVAQFVPTLLTMPKDGSGPLASKYEALNAEARELSDKTLKCYGIEPIALHSGVSFPPDFGELHEVLREAHDLLQFFAGESQYPPQVREEMKTWQREQLRKSHEALKSGTGRRYRSRS